MDERTLQQLAEALAPLIRPALRRYGGTLSLPSGILGLQFRLDSLGIDFHMLFAEFIGGVEASLELEREGTHHHQYVKRPLNSFSYALLHPDDLAQPASLDLNTVRLERAEVEQPLIRLFGPPTTWPKPIHLWRSWLKPEHTMLYYIPQHQGAGSPACESWQRAVAAGWFLSDLLRAAAQFSLARGHLACDHITIVVNSLPGPTVWDLDTESSVESLARHRDAAGAASYRFLLDSPAAFKMTCSAVRDGAPPRQLLELSARPGAQLLGMNGKSYQLLDGSPGEFADRRAVLFMLMSSWASRKAGRDQPVPLKALYAAIFGDSALESSNGRSAGLARNKLQKAIARADEWLREVLYGVAKGTNAFFIGEQSGYRLYNRVTATAAFESAVETPRQNDPMAKALQTTLLECVLMDGARASREGVRGVNKSGAGTDEEDNASDD
ncbi:MAG: hypothetical protein IT430_19930 [Phycisphaerales bacterium]|nr:hypothetical protein [Phycisphaerales bacterium]